VNRRRRLTCRLPPRPAHARECCETGRSPARNRRQPHRESQRRQQAERVGWPYRVLDACTPKCTNRSSRKVAGNVRLLARVFTHHRDNYNGARCLRWQFLPRPDCRRQSIIDNQSPIANRQSPTGQSSIADSSIDNRQSVDRQSSIANPSIGNRQSAIANRRPSPTLLLPPPALPAPPRPFSPGRP
jgi:hypothetical protein